MTNEVHVPSIENLETQAEQFKELSVEELDTVSAGSFWSDILNVVRQPLPVLASLL